MKRERILLIVATWVAILPYLGFPSIWKNILFTLTGLGLGFISYKMFLETREKRKAEKAARTFDNFSENGNFEKPEVKTEAVKEEAINN